MSYVSILDACARLELCFHLFTKSIANAAKNSTDCRGTGRGTCRHGVKTSPGRHSRRYLTAEKAWLPLWGKKGSFAMAIMSPWRRRRRRYQK